MRIAAVMRCSRQLVLKSPVAQAAGLLPVSDLSVDGQKFESGVRDCAAR
jgi:hypothetical protein